MVRSLLSRKLDILYLVFFIIHIPIMFAVDLYPLYPANFRPEWMVDMRAWYIKTYRDQFFTNPPAWFTLYMWMEALYHLPISFWAIGALIRDDPKVPLQLLLFAAQTGITTMTCVSDYLSWTAISNDEKVQLGYLYVPYMALAIFMGVDMFGRLDSTLSRLNKAPKEASKTL